MADKELVKPRHAIKDVYEAAAVLCGTPYSAIGLLYLWITLAKPHVDTFSLIFAISMLGLGLALLLSYGVLKRLGWYFYSPRELETYNKILQLRGQAHQLWAQMSELLDPATAIGPAYVLHAGGIFGRLATHGYDKARAQVSDIEVSMFKLDAQPLVIAERSDMNNLHWDYKALVQEMQDRVDFLGTAVTRCRQLELPAPVQARLTAQRWTDQALRRTRDMRVPVRIRLNPEIERRSLRDMRPQHR